MKYRALCLSVLMILASNSALASDVGEFTRGMFECDTLGLEPETQVACYEDNWHVAVNDCADTGEPSQCWMNDGQPFPIDRLTRQPLLPGLFEMPPVSGDPGGEVQGMTYWDYVYYTAQCYAMGSGSAIFGPIGVATVGAYYVHECMETVNTSAVSDCEHYQNEEHCWW